MTEPDTKLSLKPLVDKKANKVSFCRSWKRFRGFSVQPLFFTREYCDYAYNKCTHGCIGNLYQSIENLDQTYMQLNQNKDLLLKSHVPNHVAKVPLLPPDVNPAERKFYTCTNQHRCVADCKDTILAQCRTPMCYDVQFIGKNSSSAGSTSEGGYVKELVMYMVTDDLSVSPLSMVSGVALQNKFNVKDFGALEERMVEFGINEGLELLKAFSSVKGSSYYRLPFKAGD